MPIEREYPDERPVWNIFFQQLTVHAVLAITGTAGHLHASAFAAFLQSRQAFVESQYSEAVVAGINAIEVEFNKKPLDELDAENVFGVMQACNLLISTNVSSILQLLNALWRRQQVENVALAQSFQGDPRLN